MKQYFPLILIIAFFFVLKISSTGIRMSDTNIYFYTAYQLLQGNILYKDIFFTNFPLFPYISIGYFFLSFKQLSLYFFTSSIEAAIIAGVLYYHALYKTKSVLVSLLTACLYLFSFIVLTTSDHQTGVFTASLFAILSYLFLEKKKYLLVGVFTALMLMTKAYFLPIAVTYSVYLLFKQKHGIIPFLSALLCSTLVILTPTILLARHEFIYQVFNYSLTRSQGIGKTSVLWFFITHDILFFLLFLLCIYYVKKHLFFFIFSVCSLFFIFYYQDLYFLYLNFTVPFLCLFFINYYHEILAKLSIQKMVLPTIIFLLLIYNLLVYNAQFRDIQKITTIQEIAQTISTLHPSSLYGVNDTTPALAYITNTPLLNNIVDTNENIFRKGYLNATELTQDAIEQHALIIGHGAYYPSANIDQPLINELFDVKLLENANCKFVNSYPVYSEGLANRLTLISCAE